MTDSMWCVRAVRDLVDFDLRVCYTRTRAKVHIKMQFNFAVNCTEIVFCVGFSTVRRHTTYNFFFGVHNCN